MHLLFSVYLKMLVLYSPFFCSAARNLARICAINDAP